MNECESCGVALCDDCMMECNGGEFVCEDCLSICSSCSNWFCSECIQDCGGCGEPLCFDCGTECEACGDILCNDCNFECTNGGFFCEEDLYNCNLCGDLVCEDCMCSDCESIGLNCGCHDEYYCSLCGDCIYQDPYECSGCSNFFCESDLLECDVCGNGFCEDCMCSDCGLLGLECGCHDDFFCSECGACSYENMCADGGDHCEECCLICNDCGNCVLASETEFCESCEMCEDCFVNYHCAYCQECHENVDVCDQHSEPVCMDCAISEELHCPECENCYEDYAQCNESGEHCEECCTICQECYECAEGKGVDYCDLCEYCEDCWELSHCSSCGECREVVECCDNHDDYICGECAVEEDLHCPECFGCYMDSEPCVYEGKHCQNCCTCAGDGIEINDINFPDAAFRAIVAAYDLNKDGLLNESEIKAVTSMKITSDKVKSLQGIEYFSNLKSLSVLNSTINDLDGAWLPNSLQSLFLQLDKSITSIDLYGKNNLEVLSLTNGGLTELNLAMLPKLTKLNCSGNAISTLDLKNVASSLIYLDCSNNQLSGVDFSQLSKSCQVNVSGNTRTLASIPCGFNFSSLDASLDVARIVKVKGATYDSSSDIWVVAEDAEVITYSYKTASDNVSWMSKDTVYTIRFEKVTHGWSGTCSSSCSCGKESCSHDHFTDGVCDKCGMVQVDANSFPDEAWREYISKNVDSDKNGMLCASEREALTSIKATKAKGYSNLKGIEFFPNLETLSIVDTLTTPIDLSANGQLTTLKFVAGYSTGLDLSNCKKLVSVAITGATITEKSGKKTQEVKKGLTSIDLSKCTSLSSVVLNDNLLRNLNVSASHDLTKLECSNNRIEVLSIDGCKSLTTLKADGNCLMGMNLSDYTSLATVDMSDNVRYFDSIPNTFFVNQLNEKVLDVNMNFDSENSVAQDVKTKKWVVEDSTITSFTYVYNHGNKNVEDETYTIEFGKIYNVEFNDVEEVNASETDLVIYTNELTIYVQHASTDIFVYNLLGQTIDQLPARQVQSTSQLVVPTPGVYVVKSGNFSRRVLVNSK